MGTLDPLCPLTLSHKMFFTAVLDVSFSQFDMNVLFFGFKAGSKNAVMLLGGQMGDELNI